jgi:AcrR family transcriptional regulator
MPTPYTPGARPEPSWQERAVDRSLRQARAKAVETSRRFLDAAGRLLYDTGGIDFTLQQVVERSGQSIRAFYQHFAGKDELLLALFEDVMVTFAADLRAAVDEHRKPVNRLEAYVRRFHELIETAEQAGAGTRALSAYHLHLAQERPTEFATAVAPQITLLGEIVDEGVAAGQVRSDIEPATLVLLLTQSLMFAGQLSALGIHLTGAKVTADDLWAWVRASVIQP